MINNNNYIAPQQLNALSKTYGSVINQVVDKLIFKISGGMTSKRNHAELREAKTLLRQLRYMDSGAARIDEMAWALKTVKEACAREFNIHMEVFDKAAAMLDVDLSTQHIPMDMQRKINNEMQMFGSLFAAAPMAQAV